MISKYIGQKVNAMYRFSQEVDASCVARKWMQCRCLEEVDATCFQ